jgi:hypothetical protein
MLGFGGAAMLSTGITLDDTEFRAVLAMIAAALTLASAACWRRQRGPRSTSKHPRR